MIIVQLKYEKALQLYMQPYYIQTIVCYDT
jgi:hypothetical protein